MNLGELYIKVTADTSGIDSLKDSFEKAATAAENAGRRIDDAFSNAGNGANNASNSTDSLGDALEKAAAKGKLFADAIESAFQTAIDLAGKAISAISDFMQGAVGEFAAYQQNIDSMNITFGDNTAKEFAGWMQDNAAALGLSMNQMMEHANKTGTLIQKANAQLREQEAAGDQETTDQKKEALDNRLSDLRANLSNQLSETREAQAAEYNSWKDYYSNVLSELKNNLQNEYDALKQSLDNRVKEQEKANEQELRNRTQMLDASYQNYKDSLDSELDKLKENLESKLDAQREANDRQLEETERALEDAYDARKRILDDEVTDFKNATNERIKEINREYVEQFKLIDEEKYQKLKAIQDKIDAIDEERKANKRSLEDARDATKLQQLRDKLENTLALDERKKLQEQISDLELTMSQRRQDRALSDQKDSLKKEKDNINEHYSNLEDTLKEKQKEEVDSYKEARNKQLNELKRSNEDKLKEIKRANQDELDALKDSLNKKLEQLEKENEATLKKRKDRNDALLKQQKEANDEELRKLREAQQNRLDAIKSENSDILKDKKNTNTQLINEQTAFNKQQLDNLKAAQSAELREIQEHNRLLLQEESAYTKQQKKLLSASGGTYAEVTEEDRKKSVEILKQLYAVAADIGAARNMTTEQVLNILESVNYGRYATLDNLGLGYANKSGLEALVADMNEVYQQLGEADHVLSAENFGDVTKALDLLVEKYGFAGKAATEAKTTVSGSFQALQAVWTDFITALGTEDTEDDAIILKQLIGDGDQEGVIKTFLGNVVPVIERIVKGVSDILTEYGPQIADAVAPLIDLVVQSAVSLIKTYGPRIAEAVMEVVHGVHDALPQDTQNLFDGIKLAIEGIVAVFAGFAIADGVKAFSGFFETVSTSVIPALSHSLSDISGVIEVLGESLFAVGEDGVVPFGETLAELTGLGPEAGPIGAVIALIVAMIAKSEDLRNLLGDIGGTVIGGLSEAFKSLSPVIETVQGLWGKLMEGAKALGDHVVQVFGPAWEKLKETLGPPLQNVFSKLGEIFTKVKDIVLTIADAIGSVLGPILDVLGATLGPLFEGIAGFVGGTLGVLIDLLAGLCEGPLDFILTILKTLVDIIAAVFGKLGELISWLLETGKPAIDVFKDAINQITDFFKNLGAEIRKALDDPLKWLEEAGKNTVEGFKKGLEDAYNNLKKWITEQFTNIAKWVMDVLGIHSPSTVFAEIGENTINGFKNGASGDAWTNVKNFFSSIGDNLKNFFSGAGSWLTEKGKGVIDGLKGGVDNAWENVKTFFGGVKDNIGNNFNNAKDWLNGDGKDIISGMKEGVDYVWPNVSSFFGGVKSNIEDGFNNAESWLNGDGRDIINGLDNGIDYAWGNVRSFFSNIYSNISGGFANADDWLFNNGRNIMNGLYNGLVDVWNNTICPFVSNIGNWIHMNDGPEREDKQVLYDNGRWFIEGLAKGMRDAFPLVEDAVSDMVGIMDIGNQTISISGIRRSGVLDREKPINLYMTYNAGEDAQALVYDMVGQLRRYGYTMGGRRLTNG